MLQAWQSIGYIILIAILVIPFSLWRRGVPFWPSLHSWWGSPSGLVCASNLAQRSCDPFEPPARCSLDATNGNLIWEYEHPLPKMEGSYVKRQQVRARNSIALYGDRVFLTTGDARVIALDARTGKVIWNVQVADYNKGFSYTGGPLVVQDKVISGISGCTTPDTGGGCFLIAHDAGTGKELWRTYVIARPGDPADASWKDMPLERRKGGSLWGTGSYDPELDLVFWGSGPPIPHSELARGIGPADLLYTNSTLAIDPDTGKIVWHFQHLPGDNWNLDHVFERVLVDIESGGQTKHLLLTAGKTGILWALDRRDGKYQWHRETVYQNVIAKIDPETGAVNREVVPTKLEEEILVCPTLYGGRIWQATAYSPKVKALFMPLANMCNDYKVVEQPPTPGEDYGRGRFTPQHAPGNNGMVGRVEAIDVTTGKSLWKHERRPIISSGLLATAGGLVIGGDGGRRVFALDAETGAVLWELPVNSSVGGFPITYRVNGDPVSCHSDRIDHPSAVLTTSRARKHRARRSQARQGLELIGVQIATRSAATDPEVEFWAIPRVRRFGLFRG